MKLLCPSSNVWQA